ncbi:MAG: molybdopterin molybdotransferase MoeA, partial [Clostridia bacterium]|nr:molybdopterin molybdotransferase MoeA [Clostridia bacterium]
LQAGTKLDSRHIGILAALGRHEVKVRPILKAAILSTGDEVIPIEQTVKPGQVRDVNSYIVEALLRKQGARVDRLGILGDDKEALTQALQKALEVYDLVLVSGGSSAGTRDVTLEALDALGKPGAFVHGLLLKPGKPTILADINGKPAIGLPGHPLSAFVVMKLVVLPLIDILTGTECLAPDYKEAVLTRDVPSNHGREEVLPVHLAMKDRTVLAEPLFGKSGLISILSQSQGYIRIDGGAEGLEAGTPVKVYAW